MQLYKNHSSNWNIYTHSLLSHIFQSHFHCTNPTHTPCRNMLWFSSILGSKLCQRSLCRTCPCIIFCSPWLALSPTKPLPYKCNTAADPADLLHSVFFDLPYNQPQLSHTNAIPCSSRNLLFCLTCTYCDAFFMWKIIDSLSTIRNGHLSWMKNQILTVFYFWSYFTSSEKLSFNSCVKVHVLQNLPSTTIISPALIFNSPTSSFYLPVSILRFLLHPPLYSFPTSLSPFPNFPLLPTDPSTLWLLQTQLIQHHFHIVFACVFFQLTILIKISHLCVELFKYICDTSRDFFSVYW